MRIESLEGCTLIFAEAPHRGVPMEAMQLMLARHPEGLLHTGLAKLYGAVLVGGTRAQLDALERAPQTQIKRQEILDSLPHRLSPEARHWAAFGEHGLSSLSLFWLFAQHALPGYDPSHPTPLDPSDLRRCLLVICALPEAKMEKIPSLGPAWAKLYAHW